MSYVLYSYLTAEMLVSQLCSTDFQTICEKKKLFLTVLYLIIEIRRQFNYNQTYKLNKHLKESLRLKYFFFLCS